MTNTKKISEALARYYWQPGTPLSGHDFITLSRATSGAGLGELGSRFSYVYSGIFQAPGTTYSGAPFCILGTSMTEFSGPSSPDDTSGFADENTYMIPWYHQDQFNAIGVHIQFAVDKNFPVILDVRSKTLVTSVTAVASAETKEIQTKPIANNTGNWILHRNLYFGDAMMTIINPIVPASRAIAIVPRVKIPRTSAYINTGDDYYCYIYSVRVFDMMIDAPDLS